jgi:hypothetical protein
MWYRVGKQSPLDKNYIVWGNSKKASDRYGYWPSVALSKEGLVIAVHSDLAFKTASEQFYRVGWINPNGDQNQSISWISEFIHWDGGYHTSIAINDNGLIVGVHESNAFSGTGLYYRVGRLRNSAYGDFTIAWTSGTAGVNYDDGINPHIAINNQNQVVEVHQVTWEGLPHFLLSFLAAACPRRSLARHQDVISQMRAKFDRGQNISLKPRPEGDETIVSHILKNKFFANQA